MSFRRKGPRDPVDMVESGDDGRETRTTHARCRTQVRRNEGGSGTSESERRPDGFRNYFDTGSNCSDSNDEMDDGFSEGPTLQDQLAGMTVEERQEMINDEHPFGIMLWKPALRDEHSAESDSLESEAVVEPHVNRIYPQMPGFQLANLIWSLTLGWVLGLCFFSASVLASFISVAIWAIELDDGSVKLGILAFNLRELARYVFSPFGLNLIRAVHVDNWDSEALPASAESAPLLPRTTRSVEAAPQHPKFLHTMRIILTITVFPMLFGAAAVCWLLIFPIPTAKFLVKLGHELWRDPITLRVGVPTVNESHQERALESQTDLFRESAGYSSRDEAPLLSISKCTNRKFLSYTVAGMNVFIVNSLALPFFTLLLAVLSASPSVLFALALLSIIPCAYLIGAAVSAITNLTGNLALGGVLNATFGSIVELLIYTSMIRQGGKAKLVEGSLIGSFLFGLLGMPGLSMFFGGMRRRSMPFNARATGVTVTLLILSVIGVFVPTLFHNTFAPWDLFCEACPGNGTLPDSAGAKSCDMSRCWMKQPCGSASPLFVGSTRPLVFFCCGILVVTYFVGLFYTLRTHRKHIYKKDAKRRRRPKEAKPKGSGSAISRPSSDATLRNAASAPVDLPSATSERPASSSSFRRQESLRSASPSGPVDVSDVVPLRPAHLLMGDLNATSATVINSGSPDRRPVTPTPSPMPIPAGPLSVASSSAGSVSVDGEEHNGPAWNIGRSVAVLMSSTVLFSLVAEVLVRNVDAVLAAGDGDALPLDPKILGLTLFAIVPSITEVYNSISFALAGKMQLAMEIANQYTAQVALLQIPLIVGYSALHDFLTNRPSGSDSFLLVFPRWDAYAILLSVFLISYVFMEGKATYFKGAMLLVTYLILIVSFGFAPSSFEEKMVVVRQDHPI